MATNTCPNCGEKVDTKTDFCTKCGAALKGVDNKDSVAIQRTVTWFLKYARHITSICMCIGCIMIVVGIMMMGDETPGAATVIFGGVVVIGFGIIYAKDAEWKAYMLKSTHEINKKMK